ncbi:MAG: type I-C CRISPR-associated protein Cas7/Csd2 [Ignavibacteriota bacterium]
MSETKAIENRCEFVFLYDVTHGNPNGDPDAGNQPRVDPETGFGLVTDVCLKRKIRNYVALTKSYAPPHDIYVKDRGILANEQRRAYKALGIEATDRPNMDARKWMCENFYDVRTFGAVMTTGKSDADEKPEDSRGGMAGKKAAKLWNCGQVRGPVQISFSRSQSPINTLEHTITRTALTNPGDAGAGASNDDKAASGQMGRKYTVPYGLYRAHGFVSPFLAHDTGFAQADLDLLFEALSSLFEFDRSAARGEMTVRGLFVFEHDSALGNAPAHKLFESVQIEGPETPRLFSDYTVTTPAVGDLPSGVSLRRIV